MTVVYPESFKRDVLLLFNHNYKIKELLDTNNPWLGRYLDDSQPSFSATEILEALESERGTDDLKRKCYRAIRLKALYDEYWKIRKE